jgi:hypothetical protein
MTQTFQAGISQSLHGQRIGPSKILSKSPDMLELRRSPFKAMGFCALAALFVVLWVCGSSYLQARGFLLGGIE